MRDIKNIQIFAMREKYDGEVILRCIGKALVTNLEGYMEIQTVDYFAEDEERARNAFRAKVEYSFLGIENPNFRNHDFNHLQEVFDKVEIKYITPSKFWQMAERVRVKQYD